jgi:DNA-binding MarR family transcriptional regulator
MTPKVILNSFNRISEQFQRVARKFAVIESLPVTFEDGETYHSAEVHTVALIGRHPDASGTDLASLAGVTRGAISQMLSKLEKRGIIERDHPAENAKEVRARLTDKGRRLFRSHEDHHTRFDRRMLDRFDMMSEREIAFLESVLTSIERYLDAYNAGP